MKTMADWIAEKTADVPQRGEIPFKQAGVCWGLHHDLSRIGQPITDLHVVDLKEAQKPGTEERQIWRSATMTDGACMAEWTEGRNPRYTPLGKLAEMGFDGTLPKGHDFARLLMQFAKIEGCDWALHMLAALHMGHYVDRDDEEWRIGS
jgi:hypothetical protein